MSDPDLLEEYEFHLWQLLRGTLLPPNEQTKLVSGILKLTERFLSSDSPRFSGGTSVHYFFPPDAPLSYCSRIRRETLTPDRITDSAFNVSCGNCLRKLRQRRLTSG